MKYTIHAMVMTLIWKSETYFNSSAIEGDRTFQLNGYNLITGDHPSNTKQGIICFCYKESLVNYTVKSSNLSQSVICEGSIRNCNWYICVVYTSPSHDNAKFENFLP